MKTRADQSHNHNFEKKDVGATKSHRASKATQAVIKSMTQRTAEGTPGFWSHLIGYKVAEILWQARQAEPQTLYSERVNHWVLLACTHKQRQCSGKRKWECLLTKPQLIFLILEQLQMVTGGYCCVKNLIVSVSEASSLRSMTLFLNVSFCS